jgi:hypothetical protein
MNVFQLHGWPFTAPPLPLTLQLLQPAVAVAKKEKSPLWRLEFRLLQPTSRQRPLTSFNVSQ